MTRSPYAEILHLSNDPNTTLAEKTMLIRSVNDRQKLIYGEVRDVRPKIREEHVLRVGPGLHTSTITLGEVYSYGICYAYMTFAGGKYHLSANCSSLGGRSPQRYFGINLDTEVVTHGAITICGRCAGGNDEYDRY